MALVIDAAKDAAGRSEVSNEYWRPDEVPVDVDAIAKMMGLRVE